jgi:colicin import membrane protein
MWDLIRQHPKSVLVAVLIHLFLLAFFIVSVDWHHEVPAAAQPIRATMVMDAEKVSELKEQIKVEQPPEPEPEPEKDLEEERKAQEAAKKQAEEQRRAEEEKQALLQRQREEEQKQAELKRRQEAEKQKQAELKRRQEAEKKKQAELKRKQEAEKKKKAEALKRKKEAEKKKRLAAEKKRKEAERKKKLAEEKRRKEEQRLRAAEMAAEEERMAALFAEEQTSLERAQVAGLKNRYMAAIKSRVESRWLQPPQGPAGSCKVRVKQASTGKVLDVQVLPSASCNEAMRQSVDKAVWRADPLPKAPDPRVFDREIEFTFEPQT